MERQLDARRRRAARAGDRGARRRGPARARRRRRSVGDPDGRVRGLRFADGRAAGVRPGRDRDRDPAAASSSPAHAGLEVEPRDRRRRPAASARTRASLAVGECAEHRGDRARDRRADPRPGGGRGRAPSGGEEAALRGLDPERQAEGDGRRPRHGRRRRGRARGRRRRRGRRHLPQARRSRDGRAAGAVLLGDTRGAELLLDAVRRAERGRRPARAAGRGLRRRPRPTSPTARRSATATASARARSSTRSASADLGSTPGGGRASRARAPAAARASRSSPSCSRSSAAARAEEPAYLCPCRRQTREQLAAIVRERELDVGLRARRAPAAPGATAAPASRGSRTWSRRCAANRHREERHARFINDRVHANIQNDGTFSRRAADPRRRHDARTSCGGSPTSPTSTRSRW